jgi:tungstate transport system substrate-binding protein
MRCMGSAGYIGAMNQTLAIPRRPRGSAPRLLAAPVLGLLAAAVMLLAPSLASADSGATLSVVGTSDVSDSGLMGNLIQPQFSAAYPQFTFKYTGSATGTAIGNAETGTGGPSVLIVHAASLENQFVAGGFSYNNQYGNAIFRNDFVLAGPTADASHANVAANGANNIAQAFADIAAAGVATPSNATFFTRGGGTTAPGTVVAEHQYWQLVNTAGLTPAGVSLCTVSAADGGGMSPINTTVQPTSGQPCPDGGTVSAPANLPSWYKINSGNQAANVVATNACTGTGVVASGCYSLTDRGTYDYLASGTDPAGSIPNLKIVTRDNSAAAPGGANALINYFHVYIINPNKPGEQVNLPAAQDFVNFLTSPIVQARLSGYLPTVDPGGPPFVADASPTITAAGFPSTATAGTPVTVTGQVIQNEIGYPAISGQTVSIDQVKGVTPISVGSGKTDASGHYSITFTPPSSGSYQVATGAISQIEDATLSPAYGDILSPGASPASSVTVNAMAKITKTTTTSNSVTLLGTVGPAAVDSNAKVTLFARKKSSKGAFKTIGTNSVAAGKSAFSLTGKLAIGAWTVKVQYADTGAFNTATSATKNVTVALAKGPKISYKKVTVNKGTVTLTGTLSLWPKGTKGTVRLFAHALNKIGQKGKKATFTQVAKTAVKAGKKTFTLKHTFKRGYRYVLKLQYTHAGQKTTNSKFSNVVVR